MKVTFDLAEVKLVFDSRRYDRVIVISPYGEPLEISIEKLIEILDKVAAEKAERKREFGI